MLDDGQPQPGAAAGMTFIHPVKPLEHPLLRLRRDADAGIRHGQPSPLGRLLHGDPHAAALPVIGHGIVTEVVDNLLHDLGNAPDQGLTAPQLHGYLLFLRRRSQLSKDVFRLPVKLHRLPGARGAALVQPGELDDIIDQADKPFRLPMDVAGKMRHIPGLDQARPP